MAIGRIGRHKIVRNAHHVGAQRLGVRKKDIKSTKDEEDIKTQRDSVSLSDQAKKGEKAGETTGMSGRKGKKHEADEKEAVADQKKADAGQKVEELEQKVGESQAKQDELSETETAGQPTENFEQPQPEKSDGESSMPIMPGVMDPGGPFPGGMEPGVEFHGRPGTQAMGQGGGVPPGGIPPGGQVPGGQTPQGASQPSSHTEAAMQQQTHQNDMQQSQTIFMQMAADRQKWMAKMWEILQDTQTQIMEIMQGVAVRRAASMDKMAAKWAAVLGGYG